MKEYYIDKSKRDSISIEKLKLYKRLLSIKNIVIVVVIFTIMIMTSSCAKVSMPEELISGVQEKSNYADIIKLLAEEDKTITIAVDQEDSAFREINLLGDDDKEVVVLSKYKNSLDESDTYYEIQIYKYKNNRWNRLTYAPVSNGVDGNNISISKVEFGDITADGYPEILITAFNEDTGDYNLKVYSYHDGYFQNLYSDFIGDYQIFDIDSDDKQEIILIKNEEDYNYLDVLAFNGLELVETYREYIEMYANSLRLKAGRVDSKRKGIYIYGQNRYFSEDLMLLIYSGKVEEISNNSQRNNENAMIFNIIPVGIREELVNIISIEDVNNDGILDIGCLRQSAELYDYKNKIEGIKEFVTKSVRIWFTYNTDGNYTIAKREYVNKEYNFKIILPNEIRSKVAIIEERQKYNEQNNVEKQVEEKWQNKISFYDIGNEIPVKVLSIIIHKNDNFDEKDSKIIKLGKNQLYNYSASIPKSIYDKGEISEEYIKDIFRVIDRKGAEINEE
ncbi:hypothetical protein [Oceanirhabdus sp. W0125-5]|uniref:hypothetical protein n=1 Tax=Oceanirhabdus sp. W0125-5 TaxID=2999116 RepID=UPI0022F339B9|nr:hypothetical protein [Oceanirhabdus sp. W0125-5]WBW96990.1 hypothetical protein OW730_25365 [Oceanirhabdus sp. W0125-5]